MSIDIRKAEIDDANAFIAIKNRLSFKNVEGTTTTGGFLLGTDVATYRQYIANEYCLVAVQQGEIIGFGIVLKDETVRKTELWTKKELANWYIDPASFQDDKVCYFEQLAFLKGHSKSLIKLCYHILNRAFEAHDTLFTTTVHAPILNLAAIPFILRVKGQKAGNIDEQYPLIGRINSDIYRIKKEDYLHEIHHSALGAYIQQL